MCFLQELDPPPPLSIQIDVEDKKTEDIELAPLDEKDIVWQIRTFDKFMVIMTQNQVVLKTPQEWHVVAGAPGMMDCVLVSDTHLAFSHISGDILLFNTETMGVDSAHIPETPVVGRKLGTDSHMMIKKGDEVYVGRPEGMVDSIKV